MQQINVENSFTQPDNTKEKLFSKRRRVFTIVFFIIMFILFYKEYKSRSEIKNLPTAGEMVFLNIANANFFHVAGNDYIKSSVGSIIKIYLAKNGKEDEIMGLPDSILNSYFFEHNNVAYIFVYHTELEKISWECCGVYKLEGNIAKKLNKNEFPPESAYDKFIYGKIGTLATRNSNEVAIIKGLTVSVVGDLPKFTSINKAVEDEFGNWYLYLHDGSDPKSLGTNYLYYVNGVNSIEINRGVRTDLVKNNDIIYVYTSGLIKRCIKEKCDTIPGGTVSGQSFGWIENSSKLYAQGSNVIYVVEPDSVTKVPGSENISLSIERANDRIFVVEDRPLGQLENSVKLYELKDAKLVFLEVFPHSYARFEGNKVTGKIFVKGLVDTDIFNSNSLYELGSDGKLKEIKLGNKHFQPSITFSDQYGNDYVTRINNAGEEVIYQIKNSEVYTVDNKGVNTNYPAFISNAGGTYVEFSGPLYKILN